MHRLLWSKQNWQNIMKECSRALIFLAAWWWLSDSEVVQDLWGMIKWWKKNFLYTLTYIRSRELASEKEKIVLWSESYWLKQVVLWQNLCRYGVEMGTELNSSTYWVVDLMRWLIEWSTQQINQTSHWLNVWVCWVHTI